METIKKAYFTTKDIFNRYLFFTYLIIFINALIITSYILFNIYIVKDQSNEQIFGIDIKVWLPIIGGILMWSILTIITHLILFNINEINISNSSNKFAIGMLILISLTFYNYYFLFNKYDQKAKDIFQKSKFNQDEKIKEKYWKSFIVNMALFATIETIFFFSIAVILNQWIVIILGIVGSIYVTFSWYFNKYLMTLENHNIKLNEKKLKWISLLSINFWSFFLISRIAKAN